MKTFVALLRGINVGRAKRVAMSDLRKLAEGLGFESVRTVLNSGNVVFRARIAAGTAAQRMEKALVAELGVSSRIIVLSAKELGDIIETNPIPAATAEPSRFLIAVVREPGDLERIRSLAAQDWGAEKLALGERAAYMWCPSGILESRIVEATGRALGDSATTRNWATINRLYLLMGEG